MHSMWEAISDRDYQDQFRIEPDDEEGEHVPSILIHQDLTANIVKQLPEDVDKLLRHFGSGICVAGGFCRDAFLGDTPKDVDVFGISEIHVAKAVEWFAWANTEYELEVITANSRTFKPKYDYEVQPVQFVTRSVYPTHEELINSFDWSVCQCAVYYSDLEERFLGICTKAFGEDIQAGRLHYTAPERDEDPGASILRMIKLTNRGFRPTEESIAQCIGRLASEVAHGDRSGEQLYTENIKVCFRHVGYAGKKGTKS